MQSNFGTINDKNTKERICAIHIFYMMMIDVEQISGSLIDLYAYSLGFWVPSVGDSVG